MYVWRYVGLVVMTCVMSSAWAQSGASVIKGIIPKVQSWGSNPALIAAVKAQNALIQSSAAQSLDVIKALDNAWIKAPANDPLVAHVLNNPAVKELRKLASSEPYFTELILMDQQGTNVAATHRTTDYWQGDEDKFLETYPKGPQAVHKSKPQYDSSVRGYVVQLSVPIVDQGQNIGALTVNILLKAIP